MFPQKGKPQPRVKDLKSLFSVYTRFLRDDQKSAFNRSLVREAADGAPPYTDESIEMDGRFNLNFHDLSGLLEERNATYTDLIDSPSELARFFFPSTVDEVGDNDREEKAAIIAEEFTVLNRNDWADFYPNWDYLVNELNQHGLSMAYFPDEDTWKWKAAGMDDFLIPRQCRASEDAVDILFIRDKIPVHIFYKFVADPVIAKGAGWNVDEARSALVRATLQSYSKGRTWGRYWNQVVDELANNDYHCTYSKATDVEIVHALVREYDGSYSHYMFQEDGRGNDFVFQRRSRYVANEDLFTMFTARVGHNGKYHSVRGDLWRAYPEAQALNRLRCAALDSTAHSMAILLQPNDPEAMEDFALVLNGPVAWLPPEATYIQRQTSPNLAQNVLPMVQDLSSVMRTNLGLPGPQGSTQDPAELLDRPFIDWDSVKKDPDFAASAPANKVEQWKNWSKYASDYWDNQFKISDQSGDGLQPERIGTAEGPEESRDTTQRCSPERIPRSRTSLSAQREGSSERCREGDC